MIVIDGFVLVYQPYEEQIALRDGQRRARLFGSMRQKTIQADEMPEYLQNAIMRFFKEKYPEVRFGKGE